MWYVLQKNQEYRSTYEEYVKGLPAEDQARLKDEEQSKQAKAQAKAATKATAKQAAASKNSAASQVTHTAGTFIGFVRCKFLSKTICNLLIGMLSFKLSVCLTLVSHLQMPMCRTTLSHDHRSLWLLCSCSVRTKRQSISSASHR